MIDDREWVLPEIVEQHREETAHLLLQRWALLRANGTSLKALGRLDERISAHLDGLRVAGQVGWELSIAAAREQALPQTDTFAAAVLSLEAGDAVTFGALFDQESERTAPRGCLAALGWVSGANLRGVIAGMLRSPDPLARCAALETCVMHQVAPHAALNVLCEDEHADVRATALRSIGQFGKQAMLSTCLDHLSESDPSCVQAAAWSTVVLGERHHAPDVVSRLGFDLRMPLEPLLVLMLMTGERRECRALLRTEADGARNLRGAILAAGVSGFVEYVPWLIGLMENPGHARIAAESFSLITGADIDEDGLSRPAPPPRKFFPEEDDDAGEADEDAGKPCPDVNKIRAWWSAHEHRFQVETRYFLGEASDTANLAGALLRRNQPARKLAALHLLLRRKGPLFPLGAPAWRQVRLLRAMEAAA